MFASLCVKGQFKFAFVAGLGLVAAFVIASTAPALTEDHREPQTSVALEGATISLQPAPPMASALLANVLPQNDEQHLLFLSLDLKPGWKTYWRLPGRFGLAPELDWQRSSNTTSVQTFFPQPILFEEAGGLSIGYDAPTIWPVLITVQSAEDPVTIDLTLDVGLCAVLCLPEKVTLSATLDTIAGQPVARMIDVFALRQALDQTATSLARLTLTYQDDRLAVTGLSRRAGMFAVAENLEGQHAVLLPSASGDGSQIFEGAWSWTTPVTRLTVVTLGVSTEIFTSDNQQSP